MASLYVDAPLLRNKNIRPNTGHRTRKVLTAIKTCQENQSITQDLPILVETFKNMNVLFLYTDMVIYVYLKPSFQITNEVKTNKKCYHLNIDQIDESSFESSSKFILYPNDCRYLVVLAHSATSNDLFESLLTEFYEEKYNSIVDIASLVSNRKAEHRCSSEISLKTISGNKKRALKIVEPCKNNGTRTFHGEFVTYPFTGCNDLVKFPTQVSDEQKDDTRTERVCSYSGSPYWVYPDTSSARFYMEPKLTQRMNSSPSGTHRSRHEARYPDYINYLDRKESFETWTAAIPNDANLTPHKLSQAGFFYTQQADLVRCFQCGIGLKDFSEGDDPLVEHVRYSRNCPFLQEILDDQRLHDLKEQLRNPNPDFNHATQQSDQKNCGKKVQHPKYQRMEARIASYSTWPSSRTQTPQQLAEAGLFYSGSEDLVICFHCGIGLRRWDPEDEPWLEHCRWFPSCQFARQQKGDAFIARVQASIYEESERTGERVMTSSMQQLSFVESSKQKESDKLKDTCLEMGYSLADYAEAVKDLTNRGVIQPDISGIIDTIEDLKERRLQQGDNPFEQNRRLKNLVYCISCKTEEANMLFLPCAHHSYCLSCSETLRHCPICQRYITDKIRTYMS